MKSLEEVIKESTCQKRITVCELYDENNNLLTRESNRCEPYGGTCHRLGTIQNKDNYDIESSCNWIHAEMMAVQRMSKNVAPHKAILYGHDFYCTACEDALKVAGVKIFEIQKLP